jgi:hypothetical protein
MIGQHSFRIIVCFMTDSSVSSISPDLRRIKGHLKDCDLAYHWSSLDKHQASKGVKAASTGTVVASTFVTCRVEEICTCWIDENNDEAIDSSPERRDSFGGTLGTTLDSSCL